MSLASGGRMGYLLYAYRQCTDPAKNLYSFIDSLCWDTCPNGQVKDPGADICVGCHYSCQTCTGPLETECTACDGGTNFRSLDSATHECLCQNGYVDNDVAICQLCSLFIPNCQTCSSKTVCTTCVSPVFIFNPITTAC